MGLNHQRLRLLRLFQRHHDDFPLLVLHAEVYLILPHPYTGSLEEMPRCLCTSLGILKLEKLLWPMYVRFNGGTGTYTCVTDRRSQNKISIQIFLYRKVNRGGGRARDVFWGDGYKGSSELEKIWGDKNYRKKHSSRIDVLAEGVDHRAGWKFWGSEEVVFYVANPARIKAKQIICFKSVRQRPRRAMSPERLS